MGALFVHISIFLKSSITKDDLDTMHSRSPSLKWWRKTPKVHPVYCSFLTWKKSTTLASFKYIQRRVLMWQRITTFNGRGTTVAYESHELKQSACSYIFVYWHTLFSFTNIYCEVFWSDRGCSPGGWVGGCSPVCSKSIKLDHKKDIEQGTLCNVNYCTCV